MNYPDENSPDKSHSDKKPVLKNPGGENPSNQKQKASSLEHEELWTLWDLSDFYEPDSEMQNSNTQ